MPFRQINDTDSEISNINLDDFGKAALVTDNLKAHAFTLSLRKRFKSPINRSFAEISSANEWLKLDYQ
ncbi:MAG: hypothetical protein ACK5JS_02685 [Mangrovibacterium sp.]